DGNKHARLVEVAPRAAGSAKSAANAVAEGEALLDDRAKGYRGRPVQQSVRRWRRARGRTHSRSLAGMLARGPGWRGSQSEQWSRSTQLQVMILDLNSVSTRSCQE